MARQTFEDWIPEEFGGPVISKIAAISAVEALSRTEPMNTDVKNVPRSNGMASSPVVAKGGTYTEATGTNDDVTLTALKFGTVVRVADEDIKETAAVTNIVTIKQAEWARSHAIGFDHATLGTAAAANGTTVPFLSLFQALNTSNSDTGYTADANLIVTAGALTYADVSNAFGLVEESAFWADSDVAVIAHPSFKAKLRGLLDTQNRPIFVENQSQVSGTPDRLIGAPIRWSLGAKTHATHTAAPTGDPLPMVLELLLLATVWILGLTAVHLVRPPQTPRLEHPEPVDGRLAQHADPSPLS